MGNDSIIAFKTREQLRKYLGIFSHFARLAAKYALKMGADFMEKAMVGYADIASAPIDALAAMVGEKEAPKAIAQGVVDFDALPGDGEETTISIPLVRPLTGKAVGSLTLAMRG